MWSPSRRRPARGTPMVMGPLPSRSGKTSWARASRRRVSELLPSVAMSRASARVRVAAWRAATSSVVGGAGGLLELAQQPLRSIDHRRCRHLVAHGPLAPQVLVPLHRGGHRGGGVGQVGQRRRVLERGHRALRTHEVDDGEQRDSGIRRRAREADEEVHDLGHRPAVVAASSSPRRPIASTPAACRRARQMKLSSTKRSCSSRRAATCSRSARPDHRRGSHAPARAGRSRRRSSTPRPSGPTSRRHRRHGRRPAAGAAPGAPAA